MAAASFSFVPSLASASSDLINPLVAQILNPPTPLTVSGAKQYMLDKLDELSRKVQQFIINKTPQTNRASDLKHLESYFGCLKGFVHQFKDIPTDPNYCPNGKALGRAVADEICQWLGRSHILEEYEKVMHPEIPQPPRAPSLLDILLSLERRV